MYSRVPVATERASPALFLDYGADEADCGGMELSDLGMSFKSRWNFDIGAELSVSFSFHDRAGNSRRVTTTGLVVGCEQETDGRRRCVLLFLDLAEEVRVALAEVAAQLQPHIQ